MASNRTTSAQPRSTHPLLLIIPAPFLHVRGCSAVVLFDKAESRHRRTIRPRHDDRGRRKTLTYCTLKQKRSTKRLRRIAEQRQGVKLCTTESAQLPLAVNLIFRNLLLIEATVKLTSVIFGGGIRLSVLSRRFQQTGYMVSGFCSVDRFLITSILRERQPIGLLQDKRLQHFSLSQTALRY